jgi:hypothetical protein
MRSTPGGPPIAAASARPPRCAPADVALAALRVLSHLLLTDLVKPSAHVAAAARCLAAPLAHMRALAEQLFNSLAAKTVRARVVPPCAVSYRRALCRTAVRSVVPPHGR